MKYFVITIMDNDKSVEVAERCIESGKKYGHTIEMFPAITPKDNPLSLLKQENISALGFEEVYSRNLNCISAFLSHYSLWKMCIEMHTPVCIFEHDAVLTDTIPDKPFRHVINYGYPSYGKYVHPRHLGVGPLTTKRYFPGAHAYGVSPMGAKLLVDQAKVYARPTDVYLHLDTFPTLQEHYPFCAKAVDSFTTIQNQNGCIAKHNYNDDYEILDL